MIRVTPLVYREIEERVEALRKVAVAARMLADSDKTKAVTSEKQAQHAENEYQEMKAHLESLVR